MLTAACVFVGYGRLDVTAVIRNTERLLIFKCLLCIRPLDRNFEQTRMMQPNNCYRHNYIWALNDLLYHNIDIIQRPTYCRPNSAENHNISTSNLPYHWVRTEQLEHKQLATDRPYRLVVKGAIGLHSVTGFTSELQWVSRHSEHIISIKWKTLFRKTYLTFYYMWCKPHLNNTSMTNAESCQWILHKGRSNLTCMQDDAALLLTIILILCTIRVVNKPITLPLGISLVLNAKFYSLTIF